MEEGLRTLTLRLRWRLIAGLISAMLAVAFTLPVLASTVNSRASGEVIWPNRALSEVIWPNRALSEVIWPNRALSEVIWPNRALSEVIWPNSPQTGGTLGQG